MRKKKLKLSKKTDNRPSTQFYPDDWLSETGLQMCSLAAKGLWMDLLCHMFKGEKRGQLILNNRIPTMLEVAKLVSITEAEAKQLIDELKQYGVCESTDDGLIYNRRMVRDEKIRQSKVEAGRKGGRSKRPSKTQAKRGSPTTIPTTSSAPLSQQGERANFERFWEAYPKKIGIGKCQKWWADHNPSKSSTEQMIDAIAQQSKNPEWHKENGRFIPKPFTWLDEKRWLDRNGKLISRSRKPTCSFTDCPNESTTVISGIGFCDDHPASQWRHKHA